MTQVPQRATYKDITPNNFPDDYNYDAVDTRVKLRTKRVREAMYGSDVRGAMAQSEEITAVIAGEAKSAANTANAKSDDTRNRLVDQLAANSDGDIKLSEVVDARRPAYSAEAYKTIGERMDNQDSYLTNRINGKLATIRLTPEAFENEEELRDKYPQGNDQLNVTVDTGHLWIWYNGGWKDCGQYQTAGLDSEVLNKIAGYYNGIQDIRSVGGLKDIKLVDENGNRLVGNSGVGIAGQRWLINTDKTLSQDNLPADSKAVGEALITKPDAYGIPILYLYGDGIPSLKSSTDSLSYGIRYSFPNFKKSGHLNKIKVQGQTSSYLAKKNYTLQFARSVEIFPEYGKQKKYVIKADMTDFSRVRNTGCAKIWGKVRETRIKADDAIKINSTDYLVDNSGNHIVGESDPQLSIGGTYGAIDGFPIAVYINQQYWGLYNFNVSKDAYMAKMVKKPNHAIVSAVWTRLDKTTKLDGTDMEIEFCGTKDTTWVISSINALINTLIANYTSAADFDNAVSSSLDINSAIDYYVYSVAIGNTDGFIRNFLLQTWNGKKWYVATYDLDMTFGRTPRFPGWNSPVYNSNDNLDGGITFTNLTMGSRLFYQLWKFHKEDIIARYKELASGPLSSGAVSTLLANFALPIPDALLSQEDKTWPQTISSGTNNLNQIRWWYMEHINFLNSLVAND